MKKRFIATLLSVLAAPVFSASACNVDRGQEVFNKCVACHHVEKTQGHFVGPNLNEVIGRIIGSAEGFKYSRQLRKDNRVWDATLFDQFIESPAEMFPRTRMGFAGVKQSQDRADLYCYLTNLQEGS